MLTIKLGWLCLEKRKKLVGKQTHEDGVSSCACSDSLIVKMQHRIFYTGTAFPHCAS